MPQIRPVSDLRNNFSEISKIVHESREPVFLTKNGHGDMVVMSIEQYENMQYDNEIFAKLKEAELEANNSDVRYTHSEVFDKIKQNIRNGDRG
ncbi:type II toxin-antitoxin system Phd/YefM family antitoxin [Paenibacillus sp. L3-i20]|uniref:type II toxin-antitoxin system Phd/YefM family antitoxin n=1 Tax=Paenibacillus sp. L3-i20 TaxID=2905833 RepID=UPI001EDE3B79|nr:type II toxin-antitoxin system Phd/YefM family antitoxin [Paenibacillus sp. L3-i20]GKU76050.1 antitoxin [Paenibacillus sp. L3-i20]